MPCSPGATQLHTHPPHGPRDDVSNGDTHALYRFYDATGQLLYVGITADPGSRWRSHAREKPWWHQVAHITLEAHPTRETVLDAERAAIRRERPLHNVVHNRDAQPLRTLVETNDMILTLVGAQPSTGPFGTHPSHMPDDCHDHCVQHGIYRIYYPYKWRRGTAHYICQNGHHWTCGWGHDLSGDAREHMGRPVGEDTHVTDSETYPVVLS